MTPQVCAGSSTLPGIRKEDSPQDSFEQILWYWEDAIRNDPRELQIEVGPSGIGDECDRSLIHALHEDRVPEDKVNFKAEIGKAIHARLEGIFGSPEIAPGLYLVEQKVTAGVINGRPLAGSCDLFDIPKGIVWDWKTTGPTTHTDAKRKGPKQVNRIQAHIYGLGMANAGQQVTHVGHVYIERNGEFRNITPWFEPFDPQIALDAITRAEGLAQLIEAYGIKATLDMHPQLCADQYCDWCPAERAKAARANPPSTKSVLGITKGN